MSPLSVENVKKEFRQGDRTIAALDGVSLEVERGQFLAVMGASGSGKSTLLHLMAGLTQANSGRVRINGSDLGAMNDHDLTLFRRRNIGLVFQSFNLIPTLTAEENVLLPLMLEGNGQIAKAAARVDELMTSLGLASRRHHRPAVILADEPTGNLDSTNSRSVCQLLRDLCLTHGKTIIMVTHEPSVAAYARDVAVLKDGKLVCQFPADQTEGGAALGAKYQECIK
jgi:putative ABC transport system ATP-binding protein